MRLSININKFIDYSLRYACSLNGFNLCCALYFNDISSCLRDHNSKQCLFGLSSFFCMVYAFLRILRISGDISFIFSAEHSKTYSIFEIYFSAIWQSAFFIIVFFNCSWYINLLILFFILVCIHLNFIVSMLYTFQNDSIPLRLNSFLNCFDLGLNW